MSTRRGPQDLESAPGLAPISPRATTTYLYSVQLTQMYLAALPTVASSKVPETCIPWPCSFSRSKTPVPMCPGKSVLEKGCHPSLGQKCSWGWHQVAKQVAKHQKLPRSTDAGHRESVKHHEQHPCSGVSAGQVHVPSTAVLKHGIPIARPFPVNYRTSSVPHTRTRVRQRTGTKLQQQTLGTNGSHVSFDRAPEEGSYRQRIWNFGDFVFLFAESKAWL